MINDSVSPNGKEWSPEQLAKISSIVSGALGLKLNEGDVLSVNSFVFNPVNSPNPTITKWYQQEYNQQLIKYILVTFAAPCSYLDGVKTVNENRYP